MESQKTQLFCKPLSPTDINVRLSVPMESLDAFEFAKGEFKLDFNAVDIEEKQWSFRLSKRENDVHPKPVLSARWLAYVQKKRLRIDDKLLLHVERKEKEKRYRIQALRKAFRLLGSDIWVDVERIKKDVKRVPPMKVLRRDYKVPLHAS